MTHHRIRHGVLLLAILTTAAIPPSGCRSGVSPTAPDSVLAEPGAPEGAGAGRRPLRPPTSVAEASLLASVKVESPDEGLEGEIEFFLQGDSLLVVGVARGMDPHTISTSTMHPASSDCDGDPSLGVKLGKWSVNKRGIGELKRTIPAFDPFTLDGYDRVSVRRSDSRTPEKVLGCGSLVFPE